MGVNQFRIKNFYSINKTKQILGQLGLVFLQKYNLNNTIFQGEKFIEK